ncbi:MAG: filamentous hemagglutinin family protein [Verrucomicrobiota bacterium]
MRALQASARAASGSVSVPDGLVTGGLERLTGGTWTGANAPEQSGGTVIIKQTASQALLDWKTFNVGQGTTVNFDQTAGGADTGKWIAFNKVFDPSGKPSQIRGQIKADGQVYIINQNGIIFGAGSQVNTRTLVASSLPINDRLVEQGLLSNKDAQFLFSALDVPAGTDGTKAFTPAAPLTADGRNGDVVVEAGATISGPVSADGNGGRVMLVGANVRNEGTISTPSGQTILAAGLQLGVQAHNSADPSLRGLDVWIGNVGTYAGKATNSGIIEAYTGSVWMAGKEVNQLGVIDSSTSVSLNGRIDLLASYGAVGNPDYDLNGAQNPIFLNQFTGTVTLGPKSVTRILPDYTSTASIPGTSLPENSQINLQGLSIAMMGAATVLAPHADVMFKAGKWTYVDIGNNRTTYQADGTIESGLANNYDGAVQKFLYTDGQVYLDSGSLVDVSGMTDVFVPLSQNVVTVQLRGTELADSPVQRSSILRGQKLVVDLRQTGTFNGVAWVGTPLGDLTSLAGITQRDVSQLTATGGTVTMQAGGSIVVQPKATVDVSGGYFKNEGGKIQTTRLLRHGYLVDIASATPDRTYDGIYEGKTTQASAKWGVTKTYGDSLAPMGGYSPKDYISGADGGAITLTAPSIIIGGELVGQTITGPKQLDSPAQMASLYITFQADARYIDPVTGSIKDYKTSATPPKIVVADAAPRAIGDLLAEGQRLPDSQTSEFAVSTSWWSSEGGGFGHVMVDNRDGDLTIPSGVDIKIQTGGSFLARASNVTLDGTIIAPGGTVALTAYNYSPYKYQDYLNKTPDLTLEPALDPVSGRGSIRLGSAARIDVSGMILDDRPTSQNVVTTRRTLAGGSVSLEGYNINLPHGSLIDASGGALAKAVNGTDKFTYGDGGKISILAGRDPNLSTIVGGSLTLDGTLSAYSANKGGSLTIRANLIQIGGKASDPTMLVLAPEFFRTGGFTSYSLTGIGKSTKPALTAKEKQDALANPVPTPTPVAGQDPAEDTYIPAIRVVENAVIQPVAEQLQLAPNTKSGGKLTLYHTLKSQGERQPVSLTLAATGTDDPFTTNFVEARGDIVIGKGSILRTDPGASVLIGTDSTLKDGLNLADTVSMEGTIIAPGGTVAIFTRNKFRIAPDSEITRTYALPTIYIGPQAVISTEGAVVSTPDPFGRRTGILYSGGTVSIHGNIVAEAGAILDVSGSSGIFDIPASQLAGAGARATPVTSGLMSLPYNRQTVATRVDSNGGLLDLQGAEMLFTDATLLGRAGGPTATGGTLSIFSGRYYNKLNGQSEFRTSADINLIVSQSGISLQGTSDKRGVGLKVQYSDRTEVNKIKYAKGDAVPAMGYFAADSFQQGGFASLDLGYNYISAGVDLAYGGNVEFRGPVAINASGKLRLAAGGVIRADSPVNLAASYIAVGQKYQAPFNLNDTIPDAFQQFPASGLPTYNPQPSYGATGAVNFSANLIDIGTTVFQTIGKVSFAAANGDIRGSGTLSVAGDITMTAGQIYPTTLADFNIYAYDYTKADGSAGTGSVTVIGSGTRAMPYSAGGNLNIFASTITQGGTLRAPFGTIHLGWDGTDYDTSTPAFDSPLNPVVGSGLTVPTARSVMLGATSTTSVSAVDPVTGVGLTIPFGLSPDGLSWYDPTGVNVTVSGLPQKKVSIAGNSVTTEPGSVLDIRGGGDLLAYRWVAGTGGSQDLLGDATGTAKVWNSDAVLGKYSAGDLVTYNGKTWSARRAIDPKDFGVNASQFAAKQWTKSKDLTADVRTVDSSPPTPVSGSTYWTEVQTSYAVVPGYSAAYAPYAVNNTGENAKALGGDPGYTSTTLKLGDQLYIDGVNGLAAGTYTLLPKRYATLPGALLITPKSGGTFSSFSAASGSLTTSGYRVNSTSGGTFASYTTAEGAIYTSGYLANAFAGQSRVSGIRSLFEVAPSAVVADRAKYEVYGANNFISGAAGRLNVNVVQRLPMDSGYLSFQGNNALQLDGSVLASHPSGGRGARVDISSDADMFVIGGSGAAPSGAKVVLKSDVLNSWGAESILIGGLRRITDSGTIVNVRTSSVTVDNPGSSLSSPEITLVSKSALTVTAGSKVASSGDLTQLSENLLLTGDGTLLRVSGDKLVSMTRSSLAGSTLPLMTIGDGATISGAGVILDSTYGTSLSSSAVLRASYLTLGSGQISIVLDGASGGAGSVVTPHLTLQGSLLQFVQSVDSLTLSSYRTIDIYGSGIFGSSSLGSMNLFASGIRGYNRGDVTLKAGEVMLANPSYSIALASPALPLSGALNIETGTMRLGANAFSVTGYQSLNINAKNGLLATKTGSLTVPGSLTITTPLIAGAKGISYDVTAAGAVSLLRGGESSSVSGGLGASLSFTGSSVSATSKILLPSGSLTLRATGTGGGVTVGGEINVAGSSQSFYDITRYADAGIIKLVSDTGSVTLSAGSVLNVSANSGGGNAGTIDIRAGQGAFVNNGILLGSASAGATSGSFLLDAGSIPSFAAINGPLETGGFFEERNIRVRTGNVLIDGTAHARSFTLSADAGSITLTGGALLDASGTTGGSISLVAHNNVTVQSGAKLTVAAQKFNSAGKGGDIRIEAGAETNGVANTAAILDLQAGSTLDLSVAEYVAGSYMTVGSSAFKGQFQGTLQLRTPQRTVGGNLGVGVSQLKGNVIGASSILVEGYKIFTVTGATGQITGSRSSFSALPTASLAAGTTERLIYDNGVTFMGAAGATTAGYTAMVNSILGVGDPKNLSSLLVIAPGAEIINTTANGDITLGNSLSNWSFDWNLADFRFGPKSAPGMLTIRAPGNVVLWNTLSDGFTAVNPTSSGFGNSSMWLAPLMNISALLPTNTQSWSFRITAGADLSAVDASQRRSLTDPALLSTKGSVRLGKTFTIGSSNSLTASLIGPSPALSNFQVIRTGTGDIRIAAARDIKLLNAFASIYTAGARISNPNQIFSTSSNDFVTPLVMQTGAQHPSQTSQLGALQQIYAPQWSMAGGSISLLAGGTIGRYTVKNSVDVEDSSKELPDNWLYRRSYVDGSGLFGVAGVDGGTAISNVIDSSASTTWWIDFSNFFEGVGALGGGNIKLVAGNYIVNVDALIPTNARTAGLSGTTRLAPDESKFLELGGGDLTVRSGGDLSGGVYYVERGTAQISAGGSITTNDARLPVSGGDALTSLPTTLFVGKSSFNVSAQKDILLGPVVNTFWLPQGVQNKFWYKTYFSTYSADSFVNVTSFGGSITLRENAVANGRVVAGSTAESTSSILAFWLQNQNLFGSITGAAQPWVRLDETSVDVFSKVASIMPPTFRGTSFSGDINIVGKINLYPSSVGGLELAAGGSISGLNAVGRNSDKTITAYTSGSINVSDADPSLLPTKLKPYALQTDVGRNLINARQTKDSLLKSVVDAYFNESGSYSGIESDVQTKRTRHAQSVLHLNDSKPIRLYASSGDISGLTLFSPKLTQVFAYRDITDVAFYLQNSRPGDVSIVSAGRDIIPFYDNSKIRSAASLQPVTAIIMDANPSTVDGKNTKALAGDIQIGGQGTLEVLAARTLDLGTGANLSDGRGNGITSIGNSRNPYLPFQGADIVAMAGVGGKSSGPALGLAASSLDFSSVLSGNAKAAALTEGAALKGLVTFFGDLQTAGTEHATTGSYATGFEAIDALFGTTLSTGEIFTRTRDIRTTSGGQITLAAPGGGVTMSPSIFGNPLTPPGIVTEYGGAVSIVTQDSVTIGACRIFTLRGGDITIWSSAGDIAAGTSPKTVVTAPPTRIVVDTGSADIQTDLGGLATGGGIGVLASVKGVPKANVYLIAPVGTVDAGDAGIQATGNINISAAAVLNADNISSGGTTSGVPSAPSVAAPNIGGLTSASSSSGAATSAASSVANQATQKQEVIEAPSVITVEVLGYGGGEDDGG